MSTLNRHELDQLAGIETALRESDPGLDVALRTFRFSRWHRLRMAARRATGSLVVFGVYWARSIPAAHYGFFEAAPWIRRRDG